MILSTTKQERKTLTVLAILLLLGLAALLIL